jgi:MFS family permease
MITYGLSNSFAGFVVAEIIMAVGITFRTGAFQSWLVDSLKHYGHNGPYTQIFGRAALQNQLGGGVGAILGAYLASLNSALPWFVGGTTMALVAVLAQRTLKEEYFVRQKFSWRGGVEEMKKTISSSIRYGSQDKAVRFILIATFVQIYVVKAFDMYWQPFFQKKGVSEEHLGFLFFGMISSLALGSYLATRIEIRGKEKLLITSSMIFIGIMVALSTISPHLALAILPFLIHEIARGLWPPVLDSYLHERIPSHERATIISFCGMAPHIGGAIGLLVSGVLAQNLGIEATWIISSFAIILGALVVRRNGH